MGDVAFVVFKNEKEEAEGITCITRDEGYEDIKLLFINPILLLLFMLALRDNAF